MLTPRLGERLALAGALCLFAACSVAACSNAAGGRGSPGGGTSGGDAGRAGSSGSGTGNRSGSGGGDPGVVIPMPDGGSTPGPCKNLQCRQQVCAGGATTSLSGTVYAPNGTLPIYNAVVYVPNAAVPPLASGIVCDRCGTVPGGEPVVAALSDHEGRFVLNDVPVGSDIPLVIQVGKWRRQVTVPEVRACEENRLSDPDQTRLPRNRAEGDLPRIAITTGACDNLMCLLPKLGVDPEEFGVSGEDRAVTFFSGGLVAPQAEELAVFEPRLRQMRRATELWGDPEELEKYDMAIFSCECQENVENKGEAAYDAVTRYVSSGGRVFGTDYQYVWHRYSTDANLRTGSSIQGGSPPGGNPVRLDTSFPKGKALADWFAFVEPASTYGEVSCSNVFDNFTNAVRPTVQIWGSSAAEGGGASHPRFVTVNAPAGLPAEEQCGRAVHLDAHITSTFTRPILSYPRDCGADLEPGESVLAFFFFDLAACIQDDSKPTIVPPVVR